MEVKPGYKLTEVGVIPEDWEVKRLENISKVTSGKRLPSGYSLTTHVTDHPYIRVTDMNQTGINTNDLMYVPDNAYPHICRYRIFKSDLYISVAGTLGIVGKIPDILDGANLTENADRITDITCSQDYLLSVLSSPLIQDGVKSTQTVGAQPKLALIKIRNFLVPLPPLPEQTAIATTLSDVDALISSLDALISKKKQIKQGAMQELLSGKRRLPGFSGEWEVKRLGDVATLKARIGWQGLTTAEYLNVGDFYLVTGTDFKDGYINWSNCHYVDEKRYKQDRYIQVVENDVLVTKDGTIGKVALVTKIDIPATLNSGVFVIRPIDNAFHPEFFYYILYSIFFSEFLSQLSAGSTINHLYQRDFVTFTFRAPAAYSEQQAIAAILSDMDAEITTLESRRDKTKLLKQGMMQELLTGRIRLVPTILHAVSA